VSLFGTLLSERGVLGVTREIFRLWVAPIRKVVVHVSEPYFDSSQLGGWGKSSERSIILGSLEWERRGGYCSG
jgi:hypothetical protein